MSIRGRAFIAGAYEHPDRTIPGKSADHYRPGRAGDGDVAEQGEADPRPRPGDPCRRVAPVLPRHPVVPASAPGALRLPS